MAYFWSLLCCLMCSSIGHLIVNLRMNMRLMYMRLSFMFDRIVVCSYVRICMLVCLYFHIMRRWIFLNNTFRATYSTRWRDSWMFCANMKIQRRSAGIVLPTSTVRLWFSHETRLGSLGCMHDRFLMRLTCRIEGEFGKKYVWVYI